MSNKTKQNKKGIAEINHKYLKIWLIGKNESHDFKNFLKQQRVSFVITEQLERKQR